jgi:uncharacterized iron-regulated membrane protein
MTFSKFNRVFHRWGAIITAGPLLLIIITGLLLLLKKDVAWIQPPSQKGTPFELTLTFDRILKIARTVPEAEIKSWDDIDRLDVRPSKGMVKIRAKNRGEIQVDTRTGDILQVALRRSDFIESLHDGSVFHEKAKLWVFLPSALILLGLWITGVYLFILPYLSRWKRRKAVHHAQESLYANGKIQSCIIGPSDPLGE